MTQKQVQVWSELLKDLTNEQFIRGVTLFCRDHLEIYPNTNIVANIRKYAIGDDEADRHGDAMVAFQWLWNTRKTEDPIAMEVYRIIGENYGQCKTNDRSWHEKRFVEIYINTEAKGDHGTQKQLKA